jgi:hypothetical protein
MNSNEKINAAMAKMDADPELAKAFDDARRIDFPQAKTRRDAAALGLVALEAKRKSTAATSTAKTLRTVASTAASKFKKAVATITKPRTDKRVGDLPLSDWNTQHLMQAAEKGDQLAVAELAARGYTQTSNNTFSKLPS